jgi:hypothetical protein
MYSCIRPNYELVHIQVHIFSKCFHHSFTCLIVFDVSLLQLHTDTVIP